MPYNSKYYEKKIKYMPFALYISYLFGDKALADGIFV